MQKKIIRNLVIGSTLLVGTTFIIHKIKKEKSSNRKYTLIHRVPLKKYILLQEVKKEIISNANFYEASLVEIKKIENNTPNTRTFYKLPYQKKLGEQKKEKEAI